MTKITFKSSKFHVLFPLMLAVGGLSACGSTSSSPASLAFEDMTSKTAEASAAQTNQQSEEASVSTDANEASSDIDASSQLQFLAEHADLWTSQEDPYVGFYNYAVADLNQNGRLELISSICEGTGLYSTNEIWELNEAGDGLIHYEKNTMPEEDSEADMLGTTSLPVYFDAASNRYYCIFTDLSKNGAAEYHENTRSLVLENGTLNDTILAYKNTLYSDDAETNTYIDASANTISEEDYENIAATTYADFTPMTATLSWVSAQDSTESDGLDSENGSIMAAISMEERLRLLTESWNGFSLK